MTHVMWRRAVAQTLVVLAWRAVAAAHQPPPVVPVVDHTGRVVQ